MPRDAVATDAKTRRIEVGMKAGFRDAAGERVRARLEEDLGIVVEEIRVFDVYTMHADLSAEELDSVVRELFTDPVIQEAVVDGSHAGESDYVIEVGFRPGVTDNVGKSAAEGVADVIGRPLGEEEGVYKSTRYALSGGVDGGVCERIARGMLANELIQRWEIRRGGEMADGMFTALLDLPVVRDVSDPEVHEILLEVSDDELMRLSREKVFALDLREMQAIQAYYRRKSVKAFRKSVGFSENPTDIEMEILAQTWSEHCKHKIFNARIDYRGPGGERAVIESLFKTFIKGTTDEVGTKVDWLVSVFDDNAGIVRFDEEWNFALKAETHNSPSALDPYGGAMTGIVGVNRDIMGAGLGCRCIFNTDVFCVAPPTFDGPIPPRLFHPKRVLRGVHEGVKDGGNQSGIPDVNGAIVFDDRFLGKPLVFCGTGGLIPVTVAGRPSHEKAARPGDRIVMVGGRIGKDGIHGATFSSEELHEGSPATAVQIGDPITQKKMSDLLLEARDLGLFTCITDNGAGGLSSSVGEMARGPGGCEVHLDKAPLKYAGLAPWEIFLSEAQERMTVSVAPECLDAFVALAAQREVEATDLGSFTDSGRLECLFEGRLIASIEMAFLHDGVPTMELKAEWSPPKSGEEIRIGESDLTRTLKEVLATPNVCSKESFVRMYDHEVLGQSVLKQFQGVHQDGPGDAAVLRPVPGSKRGIAVACGICPKFSDLDTYWMMAAAVDEAVRNLVAVGAPPDRIAGLDNFCWPDPVQSDKTPDGEHKLAQLVRCCQALYDVCVAYGIPLISGKDSMKNDYRIGDTKISIPPTVLFTAVAVMDDVRKAVSMDVKNAGDYVYVVGRTLDEMGGSELCALRGATSGSVPKVDVAASHERYRRLHGAMEWVASCHDCSDGGLGVALAESAFAGGLGMDVDVSGTAVHSPTVALFSESQGRFVVTVCEGDVDRFTEAMAGSLLIGVGRVRANPDFIVRWGSEIVLRSPIGELKSAWQGTLDW